MNQASLNLTAIAIFVGVMAAIVLPLWGVDPTLPAGAAFMVLAIASWDSWQWGGQGGTILLDWLAGPKHRQRVLHHEAGHFLVAHLLGIPVSSYSIGAWEAWRAGLSGAGGVVFEPVTAPEPDQLCTVWMAGIAAEQYLYGQAEGGADDRLKISDYLKALGCGEAQIQLKQNQALQRAGQLIASHGDRYQKLVAAMAQRLPVADCVAILAG
jgi:hypothetical protein